jgi:3-methyladenine DNA glycosylase/8-oxoguanine DNA glycosylase
MSAEPIELPLRGAGGEPVDLWRTLQSHGFSDLPPLAPDEEARTLQATLRAPRGKPRRVTIGAGRHGVARIDVRGPALSPSARAAVAEAAAHVLRLDQDLSDFYAIAEDDPDLAWVRTGAGRMLRSPTVWEDVVKTLCTTNCSWSLTTTMVRALVTHLGEPAVGAEREPLANAFPTAETMATQDERFYREVVRSGYRAPHLVTLSRMVADGIVDLEALGGSKRDEVPDEEVEAELLALPGIGPYAAAHIMMTLGRNGKLILDSWTRPKFARLTGRRKIPSDATIARRFNAYGPDAGLAYWLFLTRDWVAD